MYALPIARRKAWQEVEHFVAPLSAEGEGYPA